MLLHDQWHVGGEDVVATVTLVYGSSAYKLASTLTDLQHSHYGKIASTLHVHLDEEDCLEVLILRGEGRALKVLAERLIGTPGVKHGAYSATARENVCAAVVPPPVTERPLDQELHLAETAEGADGTGARIHGVLPSGP
jgi:hypothetical protein